ncbi:ABC transporter ATP-binding protein [Lactococcus cremoris]|uniref:ABC transporter domain-containing protein n=1 Tax=Lactococcus lactis subsp. cremoris TaxID=1359 RepID=A0AAD1NHJ9_LACLC|nr:MULTISPECIES: ABC transporter ATP-binding protein [Lactococcus]MDU1525649.1 ABC transporter ATP-binding protein [Lactococcus lactis]MDU2184846.1 ABC transporter ATP-binding protein [Lactococcus lactis]MDU3891607.1 ABC transporter ATP-binding protein [Lactococcus lactis]MDU3960655.1 ABC transporter ATP-binding protein [Lactococcus lactis]MDU4038156.1 ABC transporter ATP-binding protein [Lactococcus lactis]
MKKGKKYAIIGDSGSGKSTLINLLVGNKRDYEGEILLDGKDYKGINRKSLPHVMSVIMQFPYLFRETVEENLTLGRKISPDIFDKSIRIACADDFVFNKLDTIYDKNLSGGQQERLSVARELMGTKPILVMDESTASVDKKTALAVEKNILENPDLTVIMITHHLYDETQNYLDEVIHLGQGIA